MEDEQFKEIMRKLSVLDSTIINIAVCMTKISDVLSTPDFVKELKVALAEMRSLFKLPLTINMGSLDEVHRNLQGNFKEIKAIAEKFKFEHTLGELKFIASKLHNLEQSVSKIQKDGVSSKLTVDVKLDDNSLVKMPVSYDPTEPIVDNNKNLAALLNTLGERYREIICFRHGLLGRVHIKTFKEIGKGWGISPGRARQIYLKGIRMLRHAAREKYWENVNCPELHKIVFADE